MSYRLDKSGVPAMFFQPLESTLSALVCAVPHQHCQRRDKWQQTTWGTEIEGSEEEDTTAMNKPIIVVSGEKESLGKILSTNTKACEMLGYNLGLITEKSVNALIPRMLKDIFLKQKTR
jgi:hypothetical protein